MSITKAHEGQQKSALEVLTEARDVLVRLRDDSVPGPWKHWPEAGSIEIYSEHVVTHGTETVIAGAIRPRFGWGEPIYQGNYEPNAALITTLHAALPALIQVLDEAVKDQAHWIDPDSDAGYEPELDGDHPGTASFLAALALAESVNGVTA